MPQTIRPATPADLSAITRIYDHAVRQGTASFEIEPPDESRNDAPVSGRCWRAAILISWRSAMAIVAGYAYAGAYRTRPAYRWTVEDSVYVDPAASRRGIGRALLDRLIAECAARDFRQMIAVIGDSAQTASIELHRAAGFRLVGNIENVGFKFGRWLDSVIMQRALGKGAATTP